MMSSMRHAYIHKNLRELNPEKLVILACHIATMFACFMPWFTAQPSFSEHFWYWAFNGPGFLIGFAIFLISLMITVLFLDKILERNAIKLPLDENYLFFAAGIQQLFLITLMWSVLHSVGGSYSDHSLRFGIFLAFGVQVCALVATFLNFQLEKQKEAKSFFQHPELPKTEAPNDK